MKVSKKDILKFNDFMCEIDFFFLLYYIIRTKGSMLYSDLKSYVIGRIDKDTPVWIWSTDNIEMKDTFFTDLDKVLSFGSNEIVCKSDLVSIIKSKYKTIDSSKIGYLYCDKLVKPKEVGFVRRAKYSDITNLIELFRDNSKESDNMDPSDKELINEIKYYINNYDLFILEDDQANILSICSYTVLDDMAKLTRVYTPMNNRRKGYCEWLVYNVCDLLIKKGYKVLLYSNYNYIPSNSAYRRIGFCTKGILNNIFIYKI